jgi:diacylglycerol kinase family enzyme
VICNGAAGSCSDDAVQQAAAVLREHADVRVASTGSAEELVALLADKPADERIVVAGGDGSLHAIATALHRAGRLDPAEPVGVLPLGTGNDLARCLGIPLDPAAAAEVVRTGAPRRLDVLTCGDGNGLVVNAAHAGIGAEAAREAGNWKERMGAAGYAVGSALAGIKGGGWRLRVEVDGRVLADGSEPVLMVGVGVGTTIGGGAPLTPDAVPDDGLADVVVSASTGAMARLGYALDLRDGDHVERDDVVTARGRQVRVSGEPFRTNTDGEVGGPYEERTWTVLPGAWSLLAPPAA